MNSDNEKRRRAVAAQGFAALAFFILAHGAHAAPVPTHAFVHPAAPGHPRALTQRRP